MDRQDAQYYDSLVEKNQVGWLAQELQIDPSSFNGDREALKQTVAHILAGKLGSNGKKMSPQEAR